MIKTANRMLNRFLMRYRFTGAEWPDDRLPNAAEPHWVEQFVGGFSGKGTLERNQQRARNARSPHLVRSLSSLRGYPPYASSGQLVSGESEGRSARLAGRPVLGNCPAVQIG